MSKLNPKPVLKVNKNTEHVGDEEGENGSFMENFDSTSFVVGLFAGVIIRWSDILPLTGGILIGVSIRNIPRWLELDRLPTYLKQARDLFKDNTLSH